MKSYTNRNVFVLLDTFSVKLKHAIKNRHLSLQKDYWTTISIVVEQFRSYNLKLQENFENRKMLQFLLFWGHFLCRSGVFGVNKKNPKSLQIHSA